MCKDIKTYLKERLDNVKLFTTKELKSLLAEWNPEVGEGTLSWQINKLKEDSFLYNIGRGVYSFEKKPEYRPSLSLKSRRLYNSVLALEETDKPPVIYETKWVNELAKTSPEKNYTIILAPKKNIERLYYAMIPAKKRIFLKPDKQVFKLYILPYNEVVMLFPLIKETPAARTNHYNTLSVEGILVDTWVYYNLIFESLGIDLYTMYKNAFEQYEINSTHLLRYASRREKRKEIECFLNRELKLIDIS